MMKKNKLNLNAIKVKSFVTNLDNLSEKTVRGGSNDFKKREFFSDKCGRGGGGGDGEQATDVIQVFSDGPVCESGGTGCVPAG